MAAVTVRHRLLTPGGTPVAARTVTAELITPSPLLADGSGSIVVAATDVSDNIGWVDLPLIPQSELGAVGSHYRITVAETWITYYCVVPAGVTPILLGNILVDPDSLDPLPPQTAALYLARAELGLPGGPVPLGDDGKIASQYLPPVGGGAVDSVNGKTGIVELDAADVGALTQDEADDRYAPIGAAAATPLMTKTFCPDDYGAVGDGIADDHAAVLAAWNAMWTWLKAFQKKQNYANFLIPEGKHYRVDASIGSRLLTSDQARAILPIPMIPRTGWTKKTVRIIGVGEHYLIRPAELGGEPEQIVPPCSLFFDSGATVHTWSNTLGLPCGIGATDADMTDAEGNTFSNVHVTLQDITIVQNDNPSLFAINLEQISTARIERVRGAIVSVLDTAPLCTHPTGGFLLLPRSNNNIAITVRDLVVEGHFTGIPMTEHASVGNAIALRCVIGLANRRPNSHHSLMHMIKIEQCLYGLAGYDPSGPGARTAFGWSGEFSFLDLEHYAYQNDPVAKEFYTPIYPGADFWDENNVITALIKMDRVNSEPAPPTGCGVAPFGESASAYVRGAANKIALWDRKMETPVDRLSNDPTPPADDELLFDGLDGPGADFDNGGTPIVLGMEWRATSPRRIKGIRYWRATAAMPANATGRLYKVTGQVVVAGTDVTFAAGAATGWIVALFVEPIVPVVGDRYEVAVRMPNGRYTATPSWWDSGPGALGRTSGGLRAENTHDTEAAGQGSFVEGAMAFPAASGNGSNYWVDVIATPDMG